MSKSNNQIVIAGNVGQEVEVKAFGENGKVANFPVAVTESYTSKAGEAKQTTTWFSVSAWNKNAEIAATFKKGSFVKIEGSVTASAYLDKESKPKATLNIKAFKVSMLEAKEVATAQEEVEA